MKKKIIISIVVILVFITSLILFNTQNKVVSTVFLDINPSIKINLNKNEKVVSVYALNEEGKEIINNGNLKGKTFDELLNVVTNTVIEKGYAENDQIVIVLYSDGNIDNKITEERVKRSFQDKNVYTEIILVENVTKDDKALAKKYNISESKAAYINSIVNENKSIEINDLLDKSVRELKETKETGRSCDEGYFLEGDFCLKEISRVAANNGKVCPNGYYEFEDRCYEETGSLNSEDYCEEGDELKDGNCIGTIKEKAEIKYDCSKGELIKKGDINPIGSPDNDKYYCVDKSTGKPPVLRCLKNSGHIMIDGRCYNGPAPTINGGCPGSDKLVNGSCYSLDDEDQWECPDGNIYEKSKDTYIELCPDTFTYTEPTVLGYTCDGANKTLVGDECVYEEIKPVLQKVTCPKGYDTNNQNRCINYNVIKDKENGLVCEQENSRLKGNQCIIYEIIDAKRN